MSGAELFNHDCNGCFGMKHDDRFQVIEKTPQEEIKDLKQEVKRLEIIVNELRKRI